MDVDRATLLSVHKQDQQEASFLLPRSSAAFKVSGMLPSDEWNGTLSLYARSAQGFSYLLPIRPKVARSGTFSFDSVPPGTYELRGRRLRGHTEYNSFTPVQITSHDISDIKIVLSPQSRSELVAALPAGMDPSLVNITMVEMESGHRAEVNLSNAPHYEVSELISGAYWISMNTQSGTDICIDTVHVDGRLADLPITVEQAFPIGTIEVSTAAECLSVKGTIESHSAGVVVVTDERLGVIRTEHTDENGVFMVGGLQSGSYRFFAWQTINGVAYRSHELLTKHLKESVAVELTGADSGTHISLQTISE
jgi:hypothetical protein